MLRAFKPKQPVSEPIEQRAGWTFGGAKDAIRILDLSCNMQGERRISHPLLTSDLVPGIIHGVVPRRRQLGTSSQASLHTVKNKQAFPVDLPGMPQAQPRSVIPIAIHRK